MIEIFNLHENIYKIGLPIIILNGGIFKDDENSPAYIKIVMQNITDRDIKSVTMDMHIFDKANKVVEIIRDYVYYADNASRDGLVGLGTYNYLNNERPSSMSIAVKSVAFYGGEDDVWQGSSSLLFEAMPSKMPLEEYFDNKELLEQYTRDFAKNFADNKEVLPVVYPFVHKDLWCCSCGRFNHDYEMNCSACGANYREQTEYLKDYTLISENLNIYKQEQEKAVSEKLAEEERLREEAEHQAFFDATIKENEENEKGIGKFREKIKAIIIAKTRKKEIVEVVEVVEETEEKSTEDIEETSQTAKDYYDNFKVEYKEEPEELVEEIEEVQREELVEEPEEVQSEELVEEPEEVQREELEEENKEEFEEIYSGEAVEEDNEEFTEEDFKKEIRGKFEEKIREEFGEEFRENPQEQVKEDKEKKIVLTDKIKKTVFISAIILIVAVLAYLAVLLFYILPNQTALAQNISASLLSFSKNFWRLI